LAWTSASTVTASLMAGLPLGTPEAYYRSSRLSTWQRASSGQSETRNRGVLDSAFNRCAGAQPHVDNWVYGAD
jgi:hypothetical protein